MNPQFWRRTNMANESPACNALMWFEMFVGERSWWIFRILSNSLIVFDGISSDKLTTFSAIASSNFSSVWWKWCDFDWGRWRGRMMWFNIMFCHCCGVGFLFKSMLTISATLTKTAVVIVCCYRSKRPNFLNQSIKTFKWNRKNVQN